MLRLEREDERGQRLRPRILKITELEKLRRETERTRAAGEQLGDAAPKVVELLEIGAMAGLVLELACADSREFAVHTFADVFREDADAPASAATSRPTSMIKRALGHVLATFYRNGRLVSRRAVHVYPGPTKPGELSDLQALWARVGETCLSGARASGWACLADELSDLPKRYERALGTLLKEQRPTVMCPYVHGDLNPRNFLLDGAGNLHVIDFSSLAEGALCRDFARIECEILFKLFCPESAEAYFSILPLLVDGGDPVRAARRLASLPLCAPVGLVSGTVLAARECLSEYAAPHASGGYDLGTDYLAALAMTALRIALFSEYLDEPQRTGAMFCSSLALERLLRAGHGSEVRPGGT